MSPPTNVGTSGNEENVPPALGRYNATTRQQKKPLQQTRVPWHRRKPNQKPAAPKPSNLVPKPISPKVVLRRAKSLAMNQAASKAVSTVWDLAKDLEADPQFDRTAAWWYRYILQIARRDQSKRRVNIWNAFLHKEVRELNDDLPVEERLTAPQHIKTLRATWNKMTQEERVEATKDAVGDVERMREMKENTRHNIVISAFHDVRANVRSMEHQISTLHNRTGAEAILIVVRADDTQLNHPHAFVTSEKVVEFFQGAYGIDVSQLGSQLESYCLSGVEGLRTNQHDSLIKLAGRTADLIKTKLDEAAHPDSIGRMNYASFTTSITSRYGIVCDGWPLQTFCSPSAIKSRLSVEILHAAWVNGSARFRRLTPAELREHREREAEERRLQAVEAAAARASPPSTDLTARPEPIPIDPALLEPAATLSTPAAAAHTSSEIVAGSSHVGEQVFSVMTSALAPTRTRKVRSDKGTTRGPYKKKPKASEPESSVA